MDREYICLKEMAEILGISRQTAKKLLLKAQKEIGFCRLGNKLLIKQKDVIAYVSKYRNIRLT